MPIPHAVVQGDSVASLAELYGLAPEKIWDDPENKALRELRVDGNILFPGDVIFIPDKEPRLEKCETTKLHMFQLLNTPSVLRLQIYDVHKPRANQDYTISLDTAPQPKAGKTDDKGILRENVNPASKTGTIFIGPDQQEIQIFIGHLNPLKELSGVQQRLGNLGFPSGPPATEETGDLKSAIARFQKEHGKDPTGKLDDGLRQLLGTIHDKPYDYPEPS